VNAREIFLEEGRYEDVPHHRLALFATTKKERKRN